MKKIRIPKIMQEQFTDGKMSSIIIPVKFPVKSTTTEWCPYGIAGQTVTTICGKSLLITSVSAKRYSDITEDEFAKVVEPIGVANLSDPEDRWRYRDYRYKDAMHPNARLWQTAKTSMDGLLAKTNSPLFGNPIAWCWVIEFKTS